MELERMLHEGIMAIVPTYKLYLGDITAIYTSKQVYEQKVKPRTFLNKMAKHYRIDMKEQQAYYSRMLGIKKNIPYVFDEKNIYIALKTRKPIAHNDGANSFVNVHFVLGAVKGTLHFKNEETLETLTRQATVLHQLTRARNIQLELERKELMKNMWVLQKMESPPEISGASLEFPLIKGTKDRRKKSKEEELL